MMFEKPKISIKKSKPPKTIKDIEDTLKEMDKIHNTSFYNWIKDENNASVIAFKTKDLFQEYYEKEPELVFNALRFLCKDWKLSKIAELILKLFYKNNIASETLAILIYEVSLLLENPEKVDLISLLLIGEEPKNAAFFLYHFFKYTEKKYRECTDITNEEDFLDEINAFCSGVLECLYSCLKWNNDYFREILLEYISLSTLVIDARREFLIRMVNVKYTRFQQELLNKNEGKNDDASNFVPHRKNSIEKIEETEEDFKKSLNFGILIFNMYQVVMRTEVDDLLTITSPTTKETPSNDELPRDKTMTINDDEFNVDSVNFCNSKKIPLKRDGDDENHDEGMKREESSATLCDDKNNFNLESTNENYDNSEMSVSVYNFGYDSSFCKTDSDIMEQEEYNSDSSFHIEELINIHSGEEEEVKEEDDDATEIDLLDGFINRSFTSNTSSTRNNSRRRCSLNLSIHTMPCLSPNGHEDNSCSRYNNTNFADHLFYVFPSPVNSPTLLTPPTSPTFLLNEPFENSNSNGKCCPSPELGEDDHTTYNHFIHSNDFCCPSSSLTSPTSSYCPLSPEYITPSPIVQSLSMDRICVNPYGYTSSFNHVHSASTISNSPNRDN